MGAQLRVYRRRIRSVRATAKITRAMELIAASRIVKAQQRVAASTPYAQAITRAVSAVASQSAAEHPLLTTKDTASRAAVLLITSDRGLAGAYSSNVLKEGESITAHLRELGHEVLPYVVGRKGIGYYRFRQREIAGEWSGFSESPSYLNAKDVADTLIEAFNPKYGTDTAAQYGITPTRNRAGELSFTYVPKETVSALPSQSVLSALAPKGTASANLAAAGALALAKKQNRQAPVTMLWWSDAKAIGDKVALAKKLGLKGVAVFKFDGGEDQGIWNVLK